MSRVPRVLVVEDEQDIAALIKHALERSGDAQVDVVSSGDTALRAVTDQAPDLVILDINLPVMSGTEVCRVMRSRAETAQTPIIMLTARTSESDRVAGLDLGADDYVTKPFGMQELVARIRAVLRRADPERAGDGLRVGDLALDRARREVTVAGLPVALTPSEFELLATLMGAPGRVFTREHLLERLQGDSPEGVERTIDVHVRNLRRKIEPDPARPRYVETVFGVGYRCRPERD